MCEKNILAGLGFIFFVCNFEFQDKFNYHSPISAFPLMLQVSVRECISNIRDEQHTFNFEPETLGHFDSKFISKVMDISLFCIAFSLHIVHIFLADG